MCGAALSTFKDIHTHDLIVSPVDDKHPLGLPVIIAVSCASAVNHGLLSFNPLSSTYMFISCVGSNTNCSWFVIIRSSNRLITHPSRQHILQRPRKLQTQVQMKESSTPSHRCRDGESVRSVHLNIPLSDHILQRWKMHMLLL